LRSAVPAMAKRDVRARTVPGFWTGVRQNRLILFVCCSCSSARIQTIVSSTKSRLRWSARCGAGLRRRLLSQGSHRPRAAATINCRDQLPTPCVFRRVARAVRVRSRRVRRNGLVRVRSCTTFRRHRTAVRDAADDRSCGHGRPLFQPIRALLFGALLFMLRATFFTTHWGWLRLCFCPRQFFGQNCRLCGVAGGLRRGGVQS
jgi:hypothetical protein